MTLVLVYTNLGHQVNIDILQQSFHIVKICNYDLLHHGSWKIWYKTVIRYNSAIVITLDLPKTDNINRKKIGDFYFVIMVIWEMIAISGVLVFSAIYKTCDWRWSSKEASDFF